MSHHKNEIYRENAIESLHQDFYDKHGRDMTSSEEDALITEEKIQSRMEALASDSYEDNDYQREA